MEVIKSDTLTEMQETNAIDQVKIAKLKESFDNLQDSISSKGYELYLEKDLTDGLFNELYPAIKWKGYESYAVSETYTQLSNSVKDGEIRASFKPEIIEAVFHFLKTHEGNGVEFAITFKRICDQFALGINEINKDRQELRDISLELHSAETGVPVEQIVKAYNESQMEG